MKVAAFLQFNQVSQEIREALVELSDAALTYDSARKQAQQKLTAAQGKLAMLISATKVEKAHQEPSIMTSQS